jgi:tetrahydromethanopterin S-methyltransferase subunit G
VSSNLIIGFLDKAAPRSGCEAMSQTIEIPDVLNRLDRLTTAVEATNASIQALDKKIDVFAAEVNGKFNAIDQRLNGLDQRIDDLDRSLSKRIEDLDKSLNKRIDSLEQRSNGQETRFWSLVGIIVTALLGILAKLAFFPAGQA